jgi:hypothetical protein
MKNYEAAKYKDLKRRKAEEKKVKKAETRTKRQKAVLKDYVNNQKFTKGHAGPAKNQSKINKDIEIFMRYAQLRSRFPLKPSDNLQENALENTLSMLRTKTKLGSVYRLKNQI